jgi:LysM repeat protein
MKNLLIFAFSLSGLVVFAQKTHTVQPKENPYAISKKYGISIDELYKLNPQVKEGKLNIGDVLVISKKMMKNLKLQKNQFLAEVVILVK